MPKKRRDIGAEILRGLREIKRGEYGRVINVPDVAQIREHTGLSQARFAQLLGVSVRTLQDWEQGAARPVGRGTDAARGSGTEPACPPRSGLIADHPGTERKGATAQRDTRRAGCVRRPRARCASASPRLSRVT